MRKTLAILLTVASAVAYGDSIRVVDTLADLDQLYPNIEQPTAIVRGRLVRDDFSPPRIYFWNPDSTSSTNDSVRPVRLGVGRWVFSTNATVLGTMTIGETNLLNVLRLKGFAFGSSGILMERNGVGTNGISIAGGIVNFRREDPGVSRFIATVADTDTTASLYLGGNAYTGFTTGRVGNIFAPGVDTSTTNENKGGGDLLIHSAAGTGTGAVSRIAFRVPAPYTNASGGLTAQSWVTMGEFKWPAYPNTTNSNTAFRLFYLKDLGGGLSSTQAIRLNITNESGILRPFFSEE